MTKITRAAVAAFALWAAAPADATDYRFAFSGAYNANFIVDTTTPNTQINFFNPYLVLFGSGSFAGVTASNVELVVYGGGSQGLDVYMPGGVLEFDGPRLYNYPWSGLPLFALQSYSLSDLDGRRVTLTISDPDAPQPSVPEPASWAMMLGGFGLVGGAMRSRRKVSVRFA